MALFTTASKSGASGDQPQRPKAPWEKIITSTPVVMTVVATILAGLSSGEMSRAQYFRALAAQAQSKAGDQWGFYQAKKNRGAAAEHVLDVQALAHVPLTTFEPEDLRQGAEAVPGVAADAQALLADAPTAQALAALARRQFPKAPQTPIADERVRKLVEALATAQNEQQTLDLVRQVDATALRLAQRGIEADAAAFDALVKPLVDAVARADALVGRIADGAAAAASAPAGNEPPAVMRLRAGFTAARLRFEAARYREEAVNNLPLGRLFEADVRLDSHLSDRHRVRSNQFFYGMLAAQGAVTLATLAIAARERSFFWGLAAAAGLAAVTFGAYVYLFV